MKVAEDYLGHRVNRAVLGRVHTLKPLEPIALQKSKAFCALAPQKIIYKRLTNHQIPEKHIQKHEQTNHQKTSNNTTTNQLQLHPQAQKTATQQPPATRVASVRRGVPAGWSKFQRRALEYSAELAGLEFVRLVPEPELAVRAYGVRREKFVSLFLKRSEE